MTALFVEDPSVLRAELEHVRGEDNSSRLYSGIGYRTPDDEHEDRGRAIRQARHEGLAC